METRRTALVDLSLDLIQKLIAHGHLAGSVYNISHKRDASAGRSGRKVSYECQSSTRLLQQSCKHPQLQSAWPCIATRGSHVKSAGGCGGARLMPC